MVKLSDPPKIDELAATTTGGAYSNLVGYFAWVPACRILRKQR